MRSKDRASIGCYSWGMNRPGQMKKIGTLFRRQPDAYR
ncbi:hypothetical protein PCH70_42960 [Pseudomonas cichorii JBC1]|nr:hypothetical protein PCH70_42960 [Pseudomonas cichorii JBC1]